MSDLQGNKGIPTLYWSGYDGEYREIIMEKLGENLEELLKLCNGKFSLKTVLMIIDQVLSTLEFIHLKGYLHRCLDPSNLLVGTKKKSKNIFVIDFGFGKKYRLNKLT